MERIDREATTFLNRLERIQNVDERQVFATPTLLLPSGTGIFYTTGGLVKTQGLGVLDAKRKDLLSQIVIRDPLEVDYLRTNVLMPRTYAESLDPIPTHISIQAIILSRVVAEGRARIENMLERACYRRTAYDTIWVEDSPPAKALRPGEVLIVMNRRTGGWDGSHERPVIELMGGGGHLPTIWDRQRQNYFQMDPTQLIVKEFREELKYRLCPECVDIVGGFHNRISNELVILCCVFIPFESIPDLQKGALNNTEQNTDGIYLGTFKGVLQHYSENASSYAGGEKAQESNFPSQPTLLERIRRRFETAF